MIKIAVASEGNEVTAHFGYCRNFNLYDTENGVIVRSESIANPGHRPGFLPNYLHDLGVNVIISGGIGGGAVEIFNGHGIEVVAGAQGDTKAAVEAYLRGALVSTGSICRDHSYHDDCGEEA